jgi:hypothetical protein
MAKAARACWRKSLTGMQRHGFSDDLTGIDRDVFAMRAQDLSRNRVLRPGGWFPASEWLIGSDTVSSEMAARHAARHRIGGRPGQSRRIPAAPVVAARAGRRDATRPPAWPDAP